MNLEYKHQDTYDETLFYCRTEKSAVEVLSFSTVALCTVTMSCGKVEWLADSSEGNQLVRK
jgi:hypothetical protein